MLTDGSGVVEYRENAFASAANGRTESARAAGFVRSKRAEVNISPFAPESGARNTFSGQPNIFQHANRRSDQRLGFTDAARCSAQAKAPK
jgi:hypothetical protein